MWTSSETDLLKEKYERADWNELLKLFPNRSKISITKKALKFGLTRRRPILERFLSFIEKTDSCWLWKGNRKSRKLPYGGFSMNGHEFYAHRVSYELFKGPIPEGMLVCHTCDNPPCVNPDHLFIGTQSDNKQDSLKKNRAFVMHGSEHPSHKLVEAQIIEIRRRSAFEPKRALAREYHVDPRMIRLIADNKVWKHVPP